MIYFIIYIIGVITSYYMGRYAIRTLYSRDGRIYNYKDVTVLFILSLCSWATFISGIIFYLIEVRENNGHPPKFL